MDSLPIILRSYAADLDAAGPQYAIMAHYLREAARRLDAPVPDTTAQGGAAAARPDGNGGDDPVPGYRCDLCED